MTKLNIDEVLALHRLGMPTSKILKTDLDAFNRLYDEHPEMDEWLEQINAALDRQERMGIVSISCQDTDFPASLLAIGDDCPPAIHCKGNLSLLAADKDVAIIGARSADKEGNTKAYQLGADYARQGYVVVSGLALGCDAAAHRGCLAAKGNTIAIVGNGLDICHPKENKLLEDTILAADGLMLSEQLIGVKANPTRLVARNRLQAALSEAVILAQSPLKGGSMYTIEFALRYGKRIQAVKFDRETDANAGNYSLLDTNQAKPI